MSHVLRGENLRLAYGQRTVADGLHLSVPTGEVTVLVGPNACGKSTALRALARLLRPAAGTVYFDGSQLATLSGRDLARRLALLPQTPVAPDGITVRDLVGRGRTPHQRWWRQWSPADEAVVDDALAATGLDDLADRSIQELSGGQRQRAWLAMALAQDTEVLLLDEPTTYLDLAYQLDVLELVVGLNRSRGRTVVMVLHDLNQAARYADHLIAMRAGRVVAAGPPTEVVTPDLVAAVFDLDAKVLTCPVAGTPLVVPVARLTPRNGETE
ncbi:ABC transporter ATP-binding protein [Planosporangium flavigriseum]|uniref:Cobalamin/Fe3+-siderophore ABC transporter ATP-binding protein n=1 Tax=Planosporangium flavigriseum TaxID=373681 RepID=A0A8J3LNC3_9ACTN|nr:ABC transporter ATP-binding protein [Planosporangium flavigriseum]NJC65445.1 ABC transporter ATP-binding protein [Planosporangium flavigriseum]GIG75867.1 cobalamin/Fe3+-siderophore ABC transporter ATP-binding protein [Planosporangium flavigriseum]